MDSRSSREQQQPWSYSCGFPASFAWPPRSYPCSFCKREFRSAQALGGHMNVHRRDRAKLRHYSPPPLPPPRHPAAAVNPNPRSAAAAAPIPNLNYPPPLHPPSGRSKNLDPERPLLAAKARAALEVSLELGIGVCCTEEDGLDLELRLGCS